MKLPIGTVIMGSEPIPRWEPEGIQEWYNQHPTEAGLARAFAIASNKFWLVEDNEYDYGEGTPEHREAWKTTNKWGELMDRLKNDIFVILRNEGVDIPEKGQIAVLIPFMERNGYYDGNGWWLPENRK